MNKILRKDNPELFDEIIDDMYEESYSDHRRGSSFYTKWVYLVDEEGFPDLDSIYYGFWESNIFVNDTEYGRYEGDINELTRVEKVEKIVTTYQWKPKQ